MDCADCRILFAEHYRSRYGSKPGDLALAALLFTQQIRRVGKAQRAHANMPDVTWWARYAPKEVLLGDALPTLRVVAYVGDC